MRSWVAPVTGLVALAVCIGVLWLASFHRAERHLVYPLDDVYITMAMAKNVALHGVWGVTPFAFSSSGSSPLYICILAIVFRVVGVKETAPAVLSIFFASLSVVSADRILRCRFKPWPRFWVLLGLVLLTPLGPMSVLGMEHTLHVLLVLWLIHTFLNDDFGPKQPALAFLAVSTRYESAFVVAGLVVVLVIRKQWTQAMAFFFIATAPILVYGVFSYYHGAYWLPNSIALKGLAVHGSGLSVLVTSTLSNIGRNLSGASYLGLLLAAMSLLLVSTKQLRSQAMLIILIISIALHLLTADVGWAFRYEGYLLAASIVFIPLAINFSKNDRSVIALTAFAAALLLARSVVAEVSMPQYSRLIYLQQFQMARFISSTRPKVVAANDIGLINFRSDMHCLDLTGLADQSVFEAKYKHVYNTAFIERESRQRDVEVAIVYDSWFSLSPSETAPRALTGPPLPSSWKRLSRWSVPLSGQLGSDTLSIYAVDSSSVLQVEAHLRDFETALPNEVTVYPDHPP